MPENNDLGANSGSREPNPSFTGSGPAGFDPGRSYSRQAAVFTVPGQVAKMCLPDGFRFVCLVSGSRPRAFPISEPGMWEVDIPMLLAKGKYPVVVVTVDVAHVAAFEKMPVAVVDDMLAASVDRSPEGEKPQALNAKHESAVAATSGETPSTKSGAPDNG